MNQNPFERNCFNDVRHVISFRVPLVFDFPPVSAPISYAGDDNGKDPYESLPIKSIKGC